MSVAAVREALSWCVRQWDRLQVELHGQYSVERLHRVHQYNRDRHIVSVLLVIVLSPVPSLLFISALELIPLEPLAFGFIRSYNFRIRCAVVTLFMAYTALEQYRQLIPSLKTSTSQIMCMSVITTAGTVLGVTIIAPFMAFPIPFMMLVVSPIYMVCLMACIHGAWRKQLQQDKALTKELQNYQIVVGLLFVLTIVYPAYEYVFRSLPSSGQLWFSFLLPVIKLAAKNAISPFCVFIEDFKPEALIFNVEIFHALFVAVCIQSTTSMKTSLVLMAMDCCHAVLSIRDMNTMIRRIVELREKVVETCEKSQATVLDQSSRADLPRKADIGHVIDHVLYLVKADTSLQQNEHIRVRSREAAEKLHRTNAAVVAVKASSNSVVPASAAVISPDKSRTTTSVIPVNSSKNAPRSTENPRTDNSTRRFSRLQHGSFGFDVSKITHSISAQEQHILMTVLTDDEREEYVERTLQLLHLVEFMILVEYTEVIIPIIYSAYLALIVHLPNRQFYPQLDTLTPNTVESAICNISLYASMEFASFVVVHIYVSRKLQFSPLRLLGFVLEKQWRLIQLKLSTWLLFMLQISLVQFGMDFSFKFKYETGIAP